jgi:uncharacterized integral membrane protein (TIGR00697 family)
MLKLYQTICAAFCVIVVVSNIISAKMVALPFGGDLSFPAGLLTYPITFLLSDLVTEIFGAKRAKLMVYIALGMSLLSFGIIQFALALPTNTVGEQTAFQSTMGLSGIRIFSSLTAYIAAQIAAIQLYALIKRWTGLRFLWVRNNGSALISQIVDTIIIDLLFLYWGLGMEMAQVLPIMLFSYAYKALFSAASTPLFYLCVFLIRKGNRIRGSCKTQGSSLFGGFLANFRFFFGG